MKRILKWLLALLVIGLIAIQFIRPERNLGETVYPGSLFNNSEVPEEVADLLINACFDCHSNHTEYPWYSRIAPVSWYLDDHIRVGKEALNFDHWSDYDKQERIGLLADICGEVESSGMPLKSYLLIHGEARLSDRDRDQLCTWADSLALVTMRE